MNVMLLKTLFGLFKFVLVLLLICCKVICTVLGRNQREGDRHPGAVGRQSGSWGERDYGKDNGHREHQHHCPSLFILSNSNNSL